MEFRSNDNERNICFSAHLHSEFNLFPERPKKIFPGFFLKLSPEIQRKSEIKIRVKIQTAPILRTLVNYEISDIQLSHSRNNYPRIRSQRDFSVIRNLTNDVDSLALCIFRNRDSSLRSIITIDSYILIIT